MMWQSMGRLLFYSGATNSIKSVNNSENGMWLFLECNLVCCRNVLVLRVVVEKLFQRKSVIPFLLSFFGGKSFVMGKNPKFFG